MKMKAARIQGEAAPNRPNEDLQFPHTLSYNWRIFLGYLIELTLSYGDLLTTVILLVIAEVVTSWINYGFGWPKEPKYQCWEAV